MCVIASTEATDILIKSEWEMHDLIHKLGYFGQRLDYLGLAQNMFKVATGENEKLLKLKEVGTCKQNTDFTLVLD